MELVLPITLHKELDPAGLENVIKTLNQQEQAGMRIGSVRAKEWKITLDLEDHITAVIGEADDDNVDISSLFWFSSYDNEWHCDVSTEELLELIHKKYGRALATDHFNNKTLKVILGIGVTVTTH